MKTAISILFISSAIASGAAAAAAQDDPGARIRKRIEREMSEALAQVRQNVRDLVLKELEVAGIGRGLGAQIDRFARTLVEDKLHNRLKTLLLSNDGKELIEGFMAEQSIGELNELIESYFEKERDGRFRLREEFEEVLSQVLDSVAPEPPPGGLFGFELSEIPGAAGMKVIKVTPDGAAAAAGLKTGDIIVSIAGKNLTAANVEEVMKSTKPGLEVKIVYERGQARTTVLVKPK
jgi:C-terminal processing protease CtpA/Prc